MKHLGDRSGPECGVEGHRVASFVGDAGDAGRGPAVAHDDGRDAAAGARSPIGYEAVQFVRSAIGAHAERPGTHDQDGLGKRFALDDDRFDLHGVDRVALVADDHVGHESFVGAFTHEHHGLGVEERSLRSDGEDGVATAAPGALVVGESVGAVLQDREAIRVLLLSAVRSEAHESRQSRV